MSQRQGCEGRSAKAALGWTQLTASQGGAKGPGLLAGLLWRVSFLQGSLVPRGSPSAALGADPGLAQCTAEWVLHPQLLRQVWAGEGRGTQLPACVLCCPSCAQIPPPRERTLPLPPPPSAPAPPDPGRPSFFSSILRQRTQTHRLG